MSRPWLSWRRDPARPPSTPPRCSPLERHETAAHAIPRPRGAGPRATRSSCTTRATPIRSGTGWRASAGPRIPAAFDRRLTEALALFAVLGRRPARVAVAASTREPVDLAARLPANGFRDVGRRSPDGARRRRRRACPCAAGELDPGVTLQAIAAPTDAGDRRPRRRGRGPRRRRSGRRPARAGACRGPAADPGRPARRAGARPGGRRRRAAVAKATTFDGCTYLSSIGTRAGLPRARAGRPRDPACAGRGRRRARLAAARTSACSAATSRRCASTSGSGSRRSASRRTCCSSDRR